MTFTADYYHYWGKAQPNEELENSPYHLLIYHSLDVAGVAYHLLHDDAPIMNDLSAYLEIPKSELRQLLCFLIGLHDLGKFASSFQGLYQPDNDDFLLKVDRNTYAYDKRHDALGWCFYQNALFNGYLGNLDMDRKTKRQMKTGLSILFNCVLGHHGKPIQLEDRPVNFDEPLAVGVKYQHEIDPKDLQAANQWIDDLKALFVIELPVELLANKDWHTRARHISWQLSGVTMLADWLGSDSTYFNYNNEVMLLADYWQMTLETAKRCVNDKGLATIAPPLPFISVENSFGFSPSPLQAWAESVTIHNYPQLFVLEDVTGSGKTEAALTLAHRLMAMGEVDGFYFGLPTTATSNAMFERIERFMPTLYCSTDDNQPSLVLAHGSKNMNETFRKLVANADNNISSINSPQNTSIEATGDEISSQCHAWFASSNKRALLANIGVGTIDQALLAALPKKHQPLRLLGLHHKVLIFDEVHSADSYMFELLKSLLQVHLHQGGHAILLTATLSLDKREALAKLWLGQEAPSYAKTVSANVTQSTKFPLATHITTTADTDIETVVETSITSPERVSRKLKVDFLQQSSDVVDYLVKASQNHQCAVWVRNTVTDAIEAYDELLNAGVAAENLLLFHSRFALVDRSRIESTVLDWFGKHSTPAKRAGKILIATQVFQESLDADADIMVSDLCPIDYLIQRAGRLHRHKRDISGQRITDSHTTVESRPSPVLTILAPKFSTEPSASWYSELFPKSQYVYRHLGQLWLTMCILQQQSYLDLPKDARLLIESVYADDAQQQIPEALLADSKADMSQQKRKQNSAKDALIDWQQGYCEDSQSRWFGSESAINSEANTRFQEMPTCEVVILKTHQAGDTKQIGFYAEASEFQLELSTVKIGESMADKLTEVPSQFAKQVALLKERYRGLEYKRLWLADADDQFIYDQKKGLVEIRNDTRCRNKAKFC
ncbi:CRISPR-associated helicase Cas3' [Psychrobacter jeotgali]|uniref:CRISPR-associated helicase Cas3' n=1 Tax=Psychrobacter jeotgali TaxID=179010 RepID=UPI001917CB3B|nr:CRISPR-associated helicase Cas3' [Psychrobacter jeotgali]